MKPKKCTNCETPITSIENKKLHKLCRRCWKAEQVTLNFWVLGGENADSDR